MSGSVLFEDEERPDFICHDCDWIGSPELPPVECPHCGSPNVGLMAP